MYMRRGRENLLTFEVEGQEVACWGSAGERLWYCACEEFERRLKQFGEGFCAHTAAVMMRCSTLGDETDVDL